MDLRKNRIPDNVKTIHLIAICGTGMGALACMLKDIGFDITGSDQKIYPPMSDFLLQKGIEIFDGFDGENIAYGPDLVVVGNTVAKNNPEANRMLEMGLNFCSMPQAINRFVAAGKKTILVAGTHGKTTTASIMAWIMYAAGLDPSFFIGGITKNFSSNYRLGNGEHIIIEGDEYDTAFFDKGPKFLHYDPFLTILTSVEFDHADIFKDLGQVKNAFDIFLSGIAENSTLIAFDSDENVAGLVNNKKYQVEKYGKDAASPWRLGSVFLDPPWTFFEVLKKEKAFGTFKTKLIGEHNLLNAVSAIAAADKLMIPADVMAEALATFEGVKRRQEVRGQKRGITVMDDFAHHPTAVKETIKAVKPFYPNGRLIAVFEPRTNSSMRKVFQHVYPLSFDLADLTCVREPPLLAKIPPDERFSSKQLTDDLKKHGRNAHYFADTDSIIDFLVKEASPGDVILIMSNGSFDNIHERLLQRL